MKTRTNQPVYKDDGTELKDTDLGDKLPVIEEGDAGKVLMVNEDEDGYELGTPSGGTKLYNHYLNFKIVSGYEQSDFYLSFITNSNTPLTNETLPNGFGGYILGKTVIKRDMPGGTLKVYDVVKISYGSGGNKNGLLYSFDLLDRSNNNSISTILFNTLNVVDQVTEL